MLRWLIQRSIAVVSRSVRAERMAQNLDIFDFALAAGTGAKVLVAYPSRPGESYYYGDRTWLEVGNTEVVAGMIADLIDCDVHKIEAAEPYPEGGPSLRHLRSQWTRQRHFLALDCEGFADRGARAAVGVVAL